jgi:4-hydroxybenzoate decarboxylase
MRPRQEYTSIGMPWTEIDYMFLNTCPPLYVQLRDKFPEVEAVNALYTHGLVVIVSTKIRVGGFGKAVGMSVLTTPHGLGYAKVVIVVDDFVDPFNLPQVMGNIHKGQSEIRRGRYTGVVGACARSRIRAAWHDA